MSYARLASSGWPRRRGTHDLHLGLIVDSLKHNCCLAARAIPRTGRDDIRNHSGFSVLAPHAVRRVRGAHLASPLFGSSSIFEAEPVQAAGFSPGGSPSTFLALASLSRGCTEVRSNGNDDWKLLQDAAQDRGGRSGRVRALDRGGAPDGSAGQAGGRDT